MRRRAAKYSLSHVKNHLPKRYPVKRHVDINNNHDYLYGIQPVTLALKSNKRKVFNLFIKTEHGKEKNRKSKLENIINNWNKVSKINFIESDIDDLHRLVGNNPHQGVVLQASKLEIETLDYLTSNFDDHFYERQKKFPLWVALDEIQDPQNMGAIIRNCVYYGIDGIITTDVRSSPLNTTVSKTSSGALEIANIYYPGNLSRFLSESKANGWRVIGTSLSDESINLFENPSMIHLKAPTILVLGSEGKGIRQKVLESCSYTVKLPPMGKGHLIGSLNVSSTLAIMLHSLINH